MSKHYSGPLRSEPIAIELHNTLYAVGGRAVDGLAGPSSADSFLRAIAPRLPRDLPPGAAPSAAQLIALRRAIRTALHDVIDDRPHDAEAVATINRASFRAPTSFQIASGRDGGAERTHDYHGADHAEAVLAAFAVDAIDLVTGSARDGIQACGAPGCVLVYFKDHPRRQWCSNACGNRARQARHYRRTHPSAS